MENNNLMRADIPDIILINRGEDGKLHHSYWTSDQQLIQFEDVEYIRKDTILEWLEQEVLKLSIRSDNDAIAWGQRNALKQVIDKINSIL